VYDELLTMELDCAISMVMMVGGGTCHWMSTGIGDEGE